jgi:drug/metabolite transporter (DMT)-like permease
MGPITAIESVTMSFLWLVVSIAFAACSNIMIKSRSLVNAGDDRGIDYIIRMALDPWVWVGGVVCGIALIAWLLAIRKLDLGVAQPVMALIFIVVPIGSYFFLNETLSPLRIAGIILILLGVFIVTRTV